MFKLKNYLIFIIVLIPQYNYDLIKEQTPENSTRNNIIMDKNIPFSEYSSEPFGLALDMPIQNFKKLARPLPIKLGTSDHFKILSYLPDLYDYNYRINPPKSVGKFNVYYALISNKYGICSLTAMDPPLSEPLNPNYGKKAALYEAENTYLDIKNGFTDKYGKPDTDEDFISTTITAPNLEDSYSGTASWRINQKGTLELSIIVIFGIKDLFLIKSVNYKRPNFDECKADARKEIDKNMQELQNKGYEKPDEEYRDAFLEEIRRKYGFSQKTSEGI
ncbi:MAG: hypothetical protein EOO69_05875 [Moraxellaceae bacterium]|nr:MAG: hypothetical protein EOO69_05875 [Moraxellaceae bacterium]